MTKAEAERIAKIFILEKAGYEMKLLRTNRSERYPDDWNVQFETRNSDGVVFDGPTIVIVNIETGQAKFFGQDEQD
ncbi:MAG: hypothetical protein NXI24_17615 [bacterium]|nr:hypothetical protein [bacterium]